MQKKYRKLYDIEAVQVDHEEFPNYLKNSFKILYLIVHFQVVELVYCVIV